MQPAGRGVLAQRGQRCVMAGVEHQHMGAVVKGHRQGALDVAAQGFDLRRQPGLGLPFGPQQLLAELGELGALAFFPDDEFAAQRLFGFLERAPDMAVRQTHMARRPRNRAVLAHRVQQVQQGVADQRVRAAFGRQLVRQLDFVHGLVGLIINGSAGAPKPLQTGLVPMQAAS